MQDTTVLPGLADDPAARSADRSPWMALVVLCAGMLMIVLDVTIGTWRCRPSRPRWGFSQAGPGLGGQRLPDLVRRAAAAGRAAG